MIIVAFFSGLVVMGAVFAGLRRLASAVQTRHDDSHIV